MKAKDTVMSNDQVAELMLAKFGIDVYEDTAGHTPAPEIDNAICLTQAEISFKAGEDKGYIHAKQHCEDVIIPQAEAQARREVVEWVENNGITQTDRWGNTIKGFRTSMPADPNFKNEWQAKLKEWGI